MNNFLKQRIIVVLLNEQQWKTVDVLIIPRCKTVWIIFKKGMCILSISPTLINKYWRLAMVKVKVKLIFFILDICHFTVLFSTNGEIQFPWYVSLWPRISVDLKLSGIEKGVNTD